MYVYPVYCCVKWDHLYQTLHTFFLSNVFPMSLSHVLEDTCTHVSSALMKSVPLRNHERFHFFAITDDGVKPILCVSLLSWVFLLGTFLAVGLLGHKVNVSTVWISGGELPSKRCAPCVFQMPVCTASVSLHPSQLGLLNISILSNLMGEKMALCPFDVHFFSYSRGWVCFPCSLGHLCLFFFISSLIHILGHFSIVFFLYDLKERFADQGNKPLVCCIQSSYFSSSITCLFLFFLNKGFLLYFFGCLKV